MIHQKYKKKWFPRIFTDYKNLKLGNSFPSHNLKNQEIKITEAHNNSLYANFVLKPIEKS